MKRVRGKHSCLFGSRMTTKMHMKASMGSFPAPAEIAGEGLHLKMHTSSLNYAGCVITSDIFSFPFPFQRLHNLFHIDHKKCVLNEHTLHDSLQAIPRFDMANHKLSNGIFM